MKIPYIYKDDVAWIIKAYLRTARIYEDNEKWEEARILYQKTIKFKTEEAKYAVERIRWIDKNILAN